MGTILKTNKSKHQITVSNYFLFFIFAGIVITLYQYDITICLYKNITGKDCFGCGMTRAIVSFYNFQIIDGINYNWKVIAVAPIMATISIKRIMKIVWLV